MARTALLRHYGKFVQRREDFISICANDDCAAQILDLLEYWTECRLTEVERVKSWNRTAVKNGKKPKAIPTLWLYETIDDFRSGLLEGYGQTYIKTRLKWLYDWGYIRYRSSGGKFDQTREYFLEIEAIQSALDGWNRLNNAILDESNLTDGQNDEKSEETILTLVGQNCLLDESKLVSDQESNLTSLLYIKSQSSSHSPLPPKGEAPPEPGAPPTQRVRVCEEEEIDQQEESGISTQAIVSDQPNQPIGSENSSVIRETKDSAPQRDNSERYGRNQSQYTKNIDGSDRLPWETRSRGVFDAGFEKHMTRSLKSYPAYQGLPEGELQTKVRKHIAGGKYDLKRRDELAIEWDAYQAAAAIHPLPAPQASSAPPPERKRYIPSDEQREATRKMLLAKKAELSCTPRNKAK
ncbi:hypothetical protein [Allocoleopsis sp.]|uniref:hypothetical protein n=1 Tax=Allocoleopsis sp. TaxID=3088169 RepID=UPI002FD0DEC7